MKEYVPELCLAYLSRVASSRYIQEMTRSLGPDHHHQDYVYEPKIYKTAHKICRKS